MIVFLVVVPLQGDEHSAQGKLNENNCTAILFYECRTVGLAELNIQNIVAFTIYIIHKSTAVDHLPLVQICCLKHISHFSCNHYVDKSYDRHRSNKTVFIRFVAQHQHRTHSPHPTAH